ncbi:hypothetical protein [Nocardioides plantarum]|uniref:Uncharacterized protein n=1 Tax=Nocardioides plantarum TaxID=29299 RepID=A0ABV5KFY4_9ACTN|nr:hypothetical protein [Nocardioides plantarum]
MTQHPTDWGHFVRELEPLVKEAFPTWSEEKRHRIVYDTALIYRTALQPLAFQFGALRQLAQALGCTEPEVAKQEQFILAKSPDQLQQLLATFNSQQLDDLRSIVARHFDYGHPLDGRQPLEILGLEEQIRFVALGRRVLGKTLFDLANGNDPKLIDTRPMGTSPAETFEIQHAQRYIADALETTALGVLADPGASAMLEALEIPRERPSKTLVLQALWAGSTGHAPSGARIELVHTVSRGALDLAPRPAISGSPHPQPPSADPTIAATPTPPRSPNLPATSPSTLPEPPRANPVPPPAEAPRKRSGPMVAALVTIVALLIACAFLLGRELDRTQTEQANGRSDDSPSTQDAINTSTPEPTTDSPANSQPPPSSQPATTPPAPVIAPAPTLRLSATTKEVDIGQEIKFKYAIKGKTAGSPEIERTAGTDDVYQSEAPLESRSGTVSIASPSEPGRFTYRINAVADDGSSVYSTEVTVNVFVRVSLAAMCNSDLSFGSCEDEPFSVDYGPRTFSYIASSGCCGTAQPPDFSDVLSFGSKTTCRSIHLEFVLKRSEYPSEALLQVKQGGSDIKSAVTSNGDLGTLDASLDGSDFFIQANDTIGDNVVFVNGYASCFTQSGRP